MSRLPWTTILTLNTFSCRDDLIGQRLFDLEHLRRFGQRQGQFGPDLARLGVLHRGRTQGFQHGVQRPAGLDAAATFFGKLDEAVDFDLPPLVLPAFS